MTNNISPETDRLLEKFDDEGREERRNIVEAFSAMHQNMLLVVSAIFAILLAQGSANFVLFAGSLFLLGSILFSLKFYYRKPDLHRVASAHYLSIRPIMKKILDGKKVNTEEDLPSAGEAIEIKDELIEYSRKTLFFFFFGVFTLLTSMFLGLVGMI